MPHRDFNKLGKAHRNLKSCWQKLATCTCTIAMLEYARNVKFLVLHLCTMLCTAY